jgi:hypothetical protein
MKCASSGNVRWTMVLLAAGAVAASCAPASIVMDDGTRDGAPPGVGGTSAGVGTGGAAGTGERNTGGWPGEVGTGGVLGTDGGTETITNGPVTVSDPEHCPDLPPLDPSPCTATEGQVCGYWWDAPVTSGASAAYREFGCFLNNQGSLVWGLLHTYQPTPALGCPRAVIANGSDCWGSVGASCPNPPFQTCKCPTGTATPTWACTTPTGPSRPATGPDVDSSRPLTQLTPAERETWCRWYLTWFLNLQPGAPDPLDTPVGSDGYIVNFGARTGNQFYADACLPVISVAQCASNLALSSCELPVSELTDCVSTLVGSDIPAPHGCGKYLSTPGCAGTIVNNNQIVPEAGANGCSIKVQ